MAIPAAPAQVQANDNGDGTWTISWPPVTGAISYRVYRAPDYTLAWQQVDAPSTTIDDINPNQNPVYAVSALNVDGESAQTRMTGAPATDPPPPSAGTPTAPAGWAIIAKVASSLPTFTTGDAKKVLTVSSDGSKAEWDAPPAPAAPAATGLAVADWIYHPIGMWTQFSDPAMAVTNFTAKAAGANTGYLVGWYVPEKATYSKIGLPIASCVNGSDVARLGIFSSNRSSGQGVGGKVLDAGTVTIAQSGTETTYAVTINQTLDVGYYWLWVGFGTGNARFYDCSNGYGPHARNIYNTYSQGDSLITGYFSYTLTSTPVASSLPGTLAGLQPATPRPLVAMWRSA